MSPLCPGGIRAVGVDEGAQAERREGTEEAQEPKVMGLAVCSLSEEGSEE